MPSITVSRKHSNGNITAGFYLVDMMARGVKDTHYIFNEPETDFFKSIYEQWPNVLQETTYPLAHNIIYRTLEFAEEYDFKPHRDFDITSHILEEDNDEIELIDLEFGVDGKPTIIDAMPFDDEDSSKNTNSLM